METDKRFNYSTYQLTSLVLLRVLIGWHFLYEGVSKIINPNWSSAEYLKESKWIFSEIFISITENADVLAIVDFINMWGLFIIGIALIAGLLSRYALWAGVGLLTLYFLATPPFIGYTYSFPSEGSYLFVNKNLVEIFAMVVLIFFPTSKIIGLDRLLNKIFERGG